MLTLQIFTASLGLALAVLVWRRQALKLKLEQKLAIAVRRDPAAAAAAAAAANEGCVPLLCRWLLSPPIFTTFLLEHNY